MAGTRNSPGPELPAYEEPEDQSHRFQEGPDWIKLTPSKTGRVPGTVQAMEPKPKQQPDAFDQELGKSDIHDILGDYLHDEMQTAVNELIHANPRLSGNGPAAVMEVDTEPSPEHITSTQDQPMETESTEPSPGTFQPELGLPSYTQSLVGSTNSLLSPITAKDNTLLDADPDAPRLTQSKAPGAR